MPFPLARAYDYAVPDGMVVAAGDYVRVTFAKRDTVGVVWGEGSLDDIDPAKLKSIDEKYDLPPMGSAQRHFIGFVARYTMSGLGAVLKMALSAPEAFIPQRLLQAYSLPTNPPVQEGRISAPRQKIITLLQDGVPRRAADITRETGATPAVMKAMVDAGQLVTIAAPTPYPCDMETVRKNELVFSGAQANAALALQGLVDTNKYAAALLDGVTGSGKTEVYFEAVAQALSAGKQALILLPEISLSTQFLQRFERRFGVAPAIWHSEVSQSQRRLAWQGVASGKTRVVIGARSALFLPYKDLGLIVVDEEHDASYKQEEGVLYHARDMAIARAHLSHFPVVLVSATPSLETMVNVKQGKYHYLHLPLRHAGATMPEMKVIDLRQSKPDRQRFIAPPLKIALAETLAAGEQSILFLNRRGYAPLTLCRTCGYRFQCPSCSAWLVEHKKGGRLQCHHCGFAQKTPDTCPGCHDKDSFAACGPGVERIEEEVKELLPDARTLILASDIITTPAMMRQAVHDIEEGRIDVIIGTQIIAKGHHFPSLTLVGVIDADLGLAGGDLRAGERTFQLLHQVAGRAGRGEKPGKVFIQTYMPEQQVIRALAASDRDAFLAAEEAERERASMPPYGKLAALILAGPDDIKLDQFCRSLAQNAPRYDDIRILGPAPAPMAYLRGKHRRRFLVKAGKNVQMQKFLSEWLGDVKVPSNIQLKVDIDPQNFF